MSQSRKTTTAQSASKIIENKQVIVQDNPKWREELDALFLYEALNHGKEKETKRDTLRGLSKPARSKDSKAIKEGDE